MYEITTNGKKKFNEYIREKIVYSDSVYDFTFENRFHIYHYKVLNEYRYVALDKRTGYGSAVINTKQPIHPNCYSALVPKILYSIKYTGDRRYLGKYSVPRNDFIDIVFRNVLPKYGYAVREEQIRLSKVMFEGLTGKRVTLSEAEVGTGKTMAYLVASLAASIYDERYSTNAAAKLEAARRTLKRSQSLYDSLYQNYVEQLMTEQEYVTLKARYKAEAEEAERLITVLEQEQRESKVYTAENRFLTEFRTFMGADTLTKEMALALVERIYVDADRNIDIRLRYRDEYMALLKFIEGRDAV